jgi:F0F1-type ATP synthase membrane subunit c/vacuolar-type H+-ATPase subunit K
MSQQPPVLTATRTRTFEQKSDMTLWIALGVGFAVVGALGAAHWVSSAHKAASAKPAVTVQAAKSSAAGTVHRCADGRVSFAPCR